MSNNVKALVIDISVAAVWLGGIIVTWKVGELIGRGTGQLCSKATQKLLTLK